MGEGTAKEQWSHLLALVGEGSTKEQNGGESGPSSPRPEAQRTQFPSELFVPELFEQLPQRWRSEQVSSSAVSPHAGPLRGFQELQLPFVSPNETPADFHSKMLWRFLFPSLVVCAGEPSVEPGCLASQGGLFSAEISLLMLNIGASPGRFVSSPFLSVLRWLLLYILTYRRSVQVVLRWFSRVGVL